MAIHERSGNLSIWWFPKEFCQSRLGQYRRSGSNSCTLISLIMANKVAREYNGFFRNANELPPRAVDMFAAAINEGNRAYRHAMATPGPSTAHGYAHTKNSKGHSEDDGSPSTRTKHKDPTDHHNDHGGSENLNIPDAISALSKEAAVNFQLQEWFYTHLRGDPRRESYSRTVAQRLARILSLGVELFRQASIREPQRYLFAAMIADSRTIIFVIEFVVNVVTIFDSHQHGRQLGAMIAQCSLHDIHELLQWHVNMVNEMYSSRPLIFEISFLTTNLAGLPQPQLLDKMMIENLEANT